MNKKIAYSAAALLLTTAAAALLSSPADAKMPAKSCDTRVNNTTAKLTECVTVEGVRAHQAALQEIADANNGIRTSGTDGYDASVDYVVEVMEAAGYDVTVQPFTFNAFIELGDPVLEQIAPTFVSYVPGTDILVMEQSEPGDVTGTVEPVDLSLGLGNTSTSGCEAADFAGFTAGNIALIQRGACNFSVKAENAAAAGAVGVIIFNQGNADGRFDVFTGTLGSAYAGGIPVLFASYDVGTTLASTPGAVVRLVADVFRGEATTYNVLAETPGGNPNNVVMVGAHLDSVNEGPGIQDNGSGSAAILEVAVQMAKVKPRNKVRFAWWGAEESGLVGSNTYVLGNEFGEGGLSDEEIEDIALYLNFDMIGSPNYVFKIYDGDESDFDLEGTPPAGSAEIEAFFEAFYESVGEPYKGTEFSGRSDYSAFINVDIPAGGLFTGAEEIKTPEEEAIWGGTAGEQLDPCYHEECDTFDNISLKALDVNADAVAAATLQYAMNTESINGKKGKGNFKPLDMPMLGSHMAK